jgi:hypothetical protein
MLFPRQLALVGTLGAVAVAALPIWAAPAVTQGTATPLRAVLVLVRPFSTPDAAQGACNALTGQVASCPVTPRLRYRLQHPVRQRENGNLVCRCQNPPRRVRAAQTDRNPFVAHVDTRWVYGASLAYTITFVVARQDDGWRVDDAYCAGRPQTSVYNPPAGPCA